MMSDAMSDALAQTAPPQVRRATLLLWLTLAVGTAASALDTNPAMRAAPVGFVVVVIGVVMAVMALLIHQIGKGRNWARMTYMVLFVLGLVPYAMGLHDLFGRAPVAGVLSLAQALMQGVALYLVFTRPGALWFRPRGKTGAESA